MRTLETFPPEEQELLRKATEVICSVARQHGVEVVQIYLFGSRARGDAQRDSDWDFYVMTSGQIDGWQIRAVVTEAKRILARLRIPNDIIFVPRGRYQRFRAYIGDLAHDVEQEGVRIL